jgi:hypothetical protein
VSEIHNHLPSLALYVLFHIIRIYFHYAYFSFSGVSDTGCLSKIEAISFPSSWLHLYIGLLASDLLVQN